MFERPDGERISDQVIDELLAASTEEEIAGPGGLLAQLSKRLVERAMEFELTDQLGCEPQCGSHGRARSRRSMPRRDLPGATSGASFAHAWASEA